MSTVNSTAPTLLDLPTEILIIICFESDNPHLPLVCTRLWRIMYKTPFFWTSIYVGGKQCTKSARYYLNERLERSIPCRLSLTIRALHAELTHRLMDMITLAAYVLESEHKERITSLDVWSDTVNLSRTMFRTILLPYTLPSLQRWNIHLTGSSQVLSVVNPSHLVITSQNLSANYPSLTTLILPLLPEFIPYLNTSIPTLNTLILDGSMSRIFVYPSLYQITQLISQTPNIEVLWYKEHRMVTNESLTPMPHHPDAQPVSLPIYLIRLKKVAVIVPGAGTDILFSIKAPSLQDLHLDGLRDDRYKGAVAWRSSYPNKLHRALMVTAAHSPGLRRLSVVGVYLSRKTWISIFGCDEVQDHIPFPLLESIAVRDVRAKKDEVTNATDDSLLELFANRGRIPLRRYAYLGSEPPLKGSTVHQLANAAIGVSTLEEAFELEIDGGLDEDSELQLDAMKPRGLTLIVHDEPIYTRHWWALGDDIDASEAGSY